MNVEKSDTTKKQEYLLEDLNKNITEAIETLKNRDAKKRVFFRGIISGVGTAIGATLVAGILLGVLAQFLVGLENLPLVGDAISEAEQEVEVTR
jgi:hypothetical protein